MADLVEEIARIYGYDNIPETRISDKLPLQLGNPDAGKGRTPPRPARRPGPAGDRQLPLDHPRARGPPPAAQCRADDKPYVRIANPIWPTNKAVLRHSVLASVLDTAERNARIRERHRPVRDRPALPGSENPTACPTNSSAWPSCSRDRAACPAGSLPTPRRWTSTTSRASSPRCSTGCASPRSAYESDAGHIPVFHPGKCAGIVSGEKQIGVFGELHPEVRDRYDWPAAFRTPILAADLDLDTLLALVPAIRHDRRRAHAPARARRPGRRGGRKPCPPSVWPNLIRQTGGKIVTERAPVRRVPRREDRRRQEEPGLQPHLPGHRQDPG